MTDPQPYTGDLIGELRSLAPRMATPGLRALIVRALQTIQDRDAEVAALREQLRLCTVAEAIAEAEANDLRADKERLDWLSGEGVVIRHGDAFGGHTQLLDDASDDKVGLGKDLRAAIDAARSGGEGEG